MDKKLADRMNALHKSIGRMNRQMKRGEYQRAWRLLASVDDALSDVENRLNELR
jgi:hypothetical protein